MSGLLNRYNGVTISVSSFMGNMKGICTLFFEDIKSNAFIKHCKLSTIGEDLNILITHPLALFLNNFII